MQTFFKNDNTIGTIVQLIQEFGDISKNHNNEKLNILTKDELNRLKNEIHSLKQSLHDKILQNNTKHQMVSLFVF